MPTTEVSPFAPEAMPDMPALDGVAIATAAAGIKYQGRTDLLLMRLPEGTVAGGALTQSRTRSAAVEWCATQLAHGRARALVVNSGNANAFTGRRGDVAVRMTAEAAAAAVGCAPEEVFIASTGVIGEPLDASGFASLLKDMSARAQGDAWHDAARAIMTTDTFAKAARHASPAINGIAKGSGMIAPDLATMLAFLVTDAKLSAAELSAITKDACAQTFNRITVDSDTSTSDTVLVFATGRAPEPAPTGDVAAALTKTMDDLALQVVSDGEGISKRIRVTVEGAESDRSARTVARAIANSPLVKTAIAGEDANWGRVVMAVGKAGEPADRDTLAIWFGDIQVARDGERDPAYDEAAASAYMTNREIEIRVALGIGNGCDSVWTCDLTHGYISINADYRS